jgi:hypothetical protein
VAFVAAFTGGAIGGKSMEARFAVPMPAHCELNFPKVAALAASIWRVDQLLRLLFKRSVCLIKRLLVICGVQYRLHQPVESYSGFPASRLLDLSLLYRG